MGQKDKDKGNGEDSPYGKHTGKKDCPCRDCTKARVWDKTRDKINRDWN